MLPSTASQLSVLWITQLYLHSTLGEVLPQAQAIGKCSAFIMSLDCAQRSKSRSEQKRGSNSPLTLFHSYNFSEHNTWLVFRNFDSASAQRKTGKIPFMFESLL